MLKGSVLKVVTVTVLDSTYIYLSYQGSYFLEIRHNIISFSSFIKL